MARTLWMFPLLGIASICVSTVAHRTISTPLPPTTVAVRSIPDSVVFGIFEGRTPCGSVANDFTGFPAALCEKIKWEITLYRDRASGSPAGYGYRGTRTSRTGVWSIHRGTPFDRNAVVYQLAYEPNPPPVSPEYK